MIRQAALAALCAIGLAACSGGDQGARGALGLVNELRDTLRANREARRSGAPAQPQVTRAILDQLTIGALEVRVEARDLTAVLIPAALRTDSGPGDVAVWATVDDAQVILRSGVLYATRGLGRDLASSDVTPAVRAVKTRAAATGAREMQIRNDNFRADTLRFRCAIDVVGDTTIVIVGRSFAVRHLRERCENDTGFFENDYYVDSARDVIQSRQWAGPGLGFLTMRVLKK
ncbi:MAG: YjbF family lipoprotein [Pseudomonadota bacterium]